VEAVIEGPREKVREMVRWCEEGPPHAGVEDVEAEFEAPGGDLDRFEVR
jgi:acylphosphatase